MRKMILCSVLAAILAAPAAAAGADQLLGAWECKTEEGTVTLVFRSDELLVYNGEEIGYRLAPGVIQALDEFLGYVDYPYTLSEGVLSITYPEGYTLNFKKTKAKPGQNDQPGDKAAPSDLVRHFAGAWKNYTQYTENLVVLNPDGTYGQRYTSSYGTEESGVAAGESRAQGTWSVRGTREKGVISFVGNDGSSSDYEYQVHVENGETYWSEYYFNGDLYGKVNE